MADDLTVRERIQLKQLVDRELDRLYRRASELGSEMGRLFKHGNRSQLRNLETVAGAATRTSALKNHVKGQTGKDRIRFEDNQTWALERDAPSLGARVMKLLDELGGSATTIVAALGIEASDEAKRDIARQVEIELQRGVVQTAVATALYGDLEPQP